jgi:uncharacterized membrane protein
VGTPKDLPAQKPQRRYLAGHQIAGSAAAGIVLAIPLAALFRWNLAPMLAWDIAGTLYVIWVWRAVWGLGAEQTAETAVFEDPTRYVSDLLTIAAALVSLVAVAVVLKDASGSKGTAQVILGLLGVASVAVSWAVVHTVFALGYARRYYRDRDGGVDFNTRDKPSYSDFAYLSFTIGMTFQVSDTTFTANEMRRTALKHALLSFVFSTGILATTVNLVANL